MREDPLFQVVPGYREAVARENFLRDAAFLPLTETVCGVECLPLTPLRFAMLQVARSPFAVGGLPAPADVVSFLWAVSADYDPAARWRRWRFIRRARKLDYITAVNAIQEYIEDAFADAPGVKERSGQNYYSGLAGIVDLLAGQYGWTEQDILNVPFKRLWQYSRCVKERLAERPIFFNASEKVLAVWQDEQDRKNKRAAETVPTPQTALN